jgi:general secretion pathway protein G
VKIINKLLFILILIFALHGLVVTALFLVAVGECPNSACSKAKADLDTYEVAIKSFQKDMGRFPTSQEGLQVLVFTDANKKLEGNYSQSGYLERLTKDPWGNDFQYAAIDNGKAVIVWSGSDESCYGINLGREVKLASEEK